MYCSAVLKLQQAAAQFKGYERIIISLLPVDQMLVISKTEYIFPEVHIISQGFI
jgi:hypothetical protein